MEIPINKIYTVGGSNVAFLTYEEAKRFVELHSNKYCLYDIWNWKITNKTLPIAKTLLANGESMI